jgi:hypothetical protein
MVRSGHCEEKYLEIPGIELRSSRPMWLPLSLNLKTLSLQSGTQLFNARDVEHMAPNTVLRRDSDSSWRTLQYTYSPIPHLQQRRSAFQVFHSQVSSCYECIKAGAWINDERVEGKCTEYGDKYTRRCNYLNILKLLQGLRTFLVTYSLASTPMGSL